MKVFDGTFHGTILKALEKLPGTFGKKLKDRLGDRFGIGTQMAIVLGGGVLVTLGAIFLSLTLMTVIEARQSSVTQVHMPALVGAFRVSASSDELVRATPLLLSAVELEDLETVRLDTEEVGTELRNAVTQTLGNLGEESGAGLQVLADSLSEVIDEIYLSMERRLDRQTQFQTKEEQVAALGLELQSLLEQEVDNQHFFMFTGLRTLGGTPAPEVLRRAPDEVSHYAGLLGFSSLQNQLTTFIQQAIAETDAEILLANSERVATTFANIGEALDDIRPPIRDTLENRITRLAELYDGEGGVFPVRTLEIRDAQAVRELTDRSQSMSAELVASIEELVGEAESATESETRGTRQLVRGGVWFLGTLGLFTFLAAIFVWKFFAEPMFVRIINLRNATENMSRGDLEVNVEIEGNDEVTDMAGALEVFRQHALEVQRLNLVEQLAEEVQANNSELESALDDLRRTQQQVITQEKLASLGALTAGIAHEIRNPLNFVNNFSALSTDLIDELREELEEGMSEDSEIDAEYVDEIVGDLDLNIRKVREHGGRADRIVEGMLAHSRHEGSEANAFDLNQVFDEYAKLAYHGLRGTDSSFNVTMVRALEEGIGSVIGVQRDITRVFLNVVTNACHATAARRAKEEGDDYQPTVWLKTTSDGPDHVIIAIRDNGTGMPKHVQEKIFEPFFTTKSGTQGTGLGLSISHEIVLGHGGSIEVETAENEFTEFRIRLPRKSEASPIQEPV